MSTGEHRLALPAGYELGKYRFGEVLGSGGFGITYLAEDRTLSRQVAVKELLPNDIATRVDGTTVVAKTQSEEESLTWARERFVNEGRALAACDHPNVVHVYEMVEANGTAYMVTKYEKGRSLERWLKDLGHVPDEGELRGILMPLLSGLERVHDAGFLHRDIKPDNIYITTNGRPVLLDFGSARQAVTNRSMAMTSIVTSGYAPFEQYYEDGNQGPWSDIYALGAVMYRAIVGKKPPESTRRLKDDPCEKLAVKYDGQYDPHFLKAIDKALSVNETKRPQSVAEWRGMLGDDAHDAVTLVRKDARKEDKQAGVALIKNLLKKNPWMAPAAGVGVVAAGLLAWALMPKSAPVPPRHDDIGNVTPSPSPAIHNPEPTATPIVIAQVTPTPADITPTPEPQPALTPAPSVVPEPTVAVIPGPTAAPVVATVVVDPQLVGSWQTGASKSKREHWQVWPDGQWVSWGVINDSGTLTASGGHLKQFSNTYQNSLDSAYEFQDAKLLTHNQFGNAEWHNSNTSTSTSSNTSRHSPSQENTPRRRNTNTDGDVGRQILGRFLQNRGL